MPYYFKTWKGRRWMKFLHHNFALGRGFINEEEALFSLNPNRYSILSELTDVFKYNQKFEFRLEYDTYNIHWAQNDNPVYLDENKLTKDEVPGLEVFEKTESVRKFGGLVRSMPINNINCTLLDGSAHSATWFYSVGMYNYTDGDYYLKGIPGDRSAEQRVTLWVRVPIFFGRLFTSCSRRMLSKYPLVLVFLIIS